MTEKREHNSIRRHPDTGHTEITQKDQKIVSELIEGHRQQVKEEKRLGVKHKQVFPRIGQGTVDSLEGRLPDENPLRRRKL